MMLVILELWHRYGNSLWPCVVTALISSPLPKLGFTCLFIG